jgi:SAM-dependent methyltransferase
MSTAGNASDHAALASHPRLRLFCVSVLLLFLELACIRWFPAHVLFLTFLTNTVLLASFLGMSLGCLASSHRRNYLVATPILLAVALMAGTAMDTVHSRLYRVVDMGHQASPQMVYFGTEYNATDLAHFAIPVEVIAGAFFVLIALLMVGPGQALGRALQAVPNRLAAYTINILGSLTGIVLFAGCSWLQLTPLCWFVPIAVGLVWLLLAGTTAPRSRWARAAVLTALLGPLVTLLPGELRAHFAHVGRETFWSPYYRITYSGEPRRSIAVNLIGHQEMIARNQPFPAYALPHLLNRDSGGKPFKDVLIIGGGSGNDVSRALEWGPSDVHIDVVEIDPVIYSLGKRDHPDRPYQDPRVHVHLDDGRNFLHSTDRKYDLVIFALVDSLVLHSSYSNIRLESYLFTRQAFADVKRCLKEDGTFVMYNYFRQGWIVSRLVKGIEEAFGAAPAVLTLPSQDVIKPDAPANGFTLCMAGSGAERVRTAFDRCGEYVLPAGTRPDHHLPCGFLVPDLQAFVGSPGDAQSLRFRLARVEQPAEGVESATDDWPFLYLRRPMIPDLSVRGMIVIGVLSLLLLGIFAPRRSGSGHRLGFDGRMFFLGAGFMLVEAKAVVHMALLFGSTWMVNSIVFFAVLVVILAANGFVLMVQPRRLLGWYIALTLGLLLNAVVPLDIFLGLPRLFQVTGACLLVFAPILCAGVIFAVSFARVPHPDRSFGFNVCGAMLGGLAEYSSMLLGFQYLVLVALAFYLLSACWPARRSDPSVQMKTGAEESALLRAA